MSGGGHILGYDAAIETQPPMGPLSAANVVPIGRWFTVEFFAEMNTPGQSNATLQVWIDGVRVVNKTGFMLSNSPTQQLFDRGRRDFTRGGGPSGILTPPEGQWVEMDRLAFYAQRIGSLKPISRLSAKYLAGFFSQFPHRRTARSRLFWPMPGFQV